MAKTLLNSKIRKAIGERMPMYWLQHGLYSLELRAVSYTYENGRERTRKLAEFDLKDEIPVIFQVHMEICKQVSTANAPDIVTALQHAYWEGTLERSPQVMWDEYQNQKDGRK